MNDKVTIGIFGALAVGAVTLTAILAGGDPENLILPTPPPLAANDAGYYFTLHEAEIPSTPPRIEYRLMVTRDPVKAEKRRQSGSYKGSHWKDIKEHPASNTHIWGNPMPGRPRR